MSRRLLTHLLAFVITLYAATRLHATTWYVDPLATGSGAGTSWPDAFTDLQPALNNVSLAPGDTIQVALGTYLPGPTSSDTFYVLAGISVKGGYFIDPMDPDYGAPWYDPQQIGRSVLEGALSSTDTVVTLGAPVTGTATTSLDHFTVQNAAGGNAALAGGLVANSSNLAVVLSDFLVQTCHADGNAGGMSINAKSILLTRVALDGNTGISSPAVALAGGAWLNVEGSLGTITIVDSIFYKNDAANVGGAYCTAERIRVRGSVFSSNTSHDGTPNERGGGLVTAGSGTVTISTIDIVRSKFRSNDGVSRGGGATILGGNLRLWHTEFSDNRVTGGAGGGLYADVASAQIVNNVFLENSTRLMATGLGGGAYVKAPATSIINCNFIGNTVMSNGDGEGLYVINHTSTVDICNCIFWNDFTAGTLHEDIGTDGSGGSVLTSVCVNYSDVQVPASDARFCAGTGNISSCPVFVDDASPSCISYVNFAPCTMTTPTALISAAGPTYVPIMLPSTSSPVKNAGSNACLPADPFDLDGDSNTAETLPTDMTILCSESLPKKRIIASTVDMGAYEVPCSAVDHDGDGNVTLDDLFIFINDWFQGCVGQPGSPCFGRDTDFDNSGTLTIDDIFIYLNAWFVGC